MKKVLLIWVSILAMSFVSVTSAAYSEISCSTDPDFAANSCTQCFDWGSKSEWDQLWLLTDVWSNGTSKPMYMLKAQNELTDAVRMISLNGAAWSYEPTKDGFWEYTPSLEKLTNDGWFYTLEAWKSVDWIQSKLGYSIKLNKTAEAWKNIWLLKYTLNVHGDDAGTPAEATTSHTECVIFKSAGASETPTPKKEEPKKLPQTWPQEVLLLLLSLLLAGGLFFISRKKA